MLKISVHTKDTHKSDLNDFDLSIKNFSSVYHGFKACKDKTLQALKINTVY